MRFSFIKRAAVPGVSIFLAAVWSSSPPAAQARQQYLKMFIDGYPRVASAAASKKCALCHEKDDKKKRLPYGKAVEAGLGAKNVKDELKIVNALKKAENGKGSKGQTFGQMIENGKLPE